MAEIVQPVVRSLLGHVRPPDEPIVIEDLAAWTPADPSVFALDICFYIGDAADPPDVVDDFEAVVCSPRWLTDHHPGLEAEDPDRALWYRTGRGLWTMNRWDPDALQRDLTAVWRMRRDRTGRWLRIGSAATWIGNTTTDWTKSWVHRLRHSGSPLACWPTAVVFGMKDDGRRAPAADAGCQPAIGRTGPL
jgi:hypothetical protein